MSKFRKIMAIVLSCMMLLSVISITAMADDGQWTTVELGNTVISITAMVDDGQWTTVELDNTKKKQTIEVNLEQDMWYSWYLDNNSEGEISVTEISEGSEVEPKGQLAAGMSGGVTSGKASEPLKKGKYTFVIEALGENNLNGVFRYMFTNNPENISTKYDRNDGPKLYVGEAQPILSVTDKKQDAPAIILLENPTLNVMNDLLQYGIIHGDPNGDMRLYSAITRAEMAKVLSKMRGLNPNAPEFPTFSDVSASHWAYSYIECINAEGIIEGNGDGTFSPEANILFKDAVKMIVSAMGYAPQAEQMGGYPHGYAMVANQLGVTKAIDHALDVECVRNTVFMMLYNAMDVPFMVQTGFGTNAEYQIADGKDGRDHITFRERITGTPATYTQEYIDELKKFMEGGEYYDEIAAELEEFWKPEGFNGTYTFEIIYAELNDDATQISLKIRITPDNGEICYVHLGYAKVDGKWQF